MVTFARSPHQWTHWADIWGYSDKPNKYYNDFLNFFLPSRDSKRRVQDKVLSLSICTAGLAPHKVLRISKPEKHRRGNPVTFSVTTDPGVTSFCWTRLHSQRIRTCSVVLCEEQFPLRWRLQKECLHMCCYDFLPSLRTQRIPKQQKY